MFFYNLKIAVRTAFRHFGYTLINFLGIAVGIAVCILIGLYIQNELSYDRYHKNYKNIYRLADKVEGASYENGIAKVAGPWAPAAVEAIPEVKTACRFTATGELLFAKGTKKIYESNGFFADSSVFEVFGWQLPVGDPKTVLREPNTIVITRSFAAKYFGQSNPIGEMLTIDNSTPYRVTGIMQDVPANSHFHFDFLLSMRSYTGTDITSWTRPQFYTYVLLQPGTSPTAVALKMDKVLARNTDSSSSAASTPLLQRIDKIHLRSKLFRELEANSDISYIYIFGILGLFIIIIACLNFINLSTAQAIRRSNEVGIRKANGATKRSLVGQYLFEAVVICLISAILAVGLVWLALPSLNTFLGKQLSFNLFRNQWMGIGLPVLVLIVGVLSGFYPAILLSSFKPIGMLGNRSGTGVHFGLRKVLVISQFVISIVMIIAALVSGLQLRYIHNKNLGFNKDQVVIIPFRDGETVNHIETIKQQLLQIPGVQKVSASSNRPGGSDFGIPYNIVGLPKDRQPDMRCLVVDQDFLSTYEMQMAHGRGFRNDLASDTATYLINEEAARQLGFKDPLGQIMEMPSINRGPAPIVGVVRDFHFHSLHEKIAPLFFFMQKTWFGQLSVRIKTDQTDKTLALLHDKWLSIEASYPFTYSFFDETFSNMYQAESRATGLIRIFAFLAIFIACLGLLGLSAYTIGQRTKEIGIRKVLGAGVGSIAGLLSKDFLKLVFIAALVAFPLAWWMMNRWLDDFAYRIRISWLIFIIAGIIALFIALITLSFQAIRAAVANPVTSLRTE